MKKFTEQKKQFIANRVCIIWLCIIFIFLINGGYQSAKKIVESRSIISGTNTVIWADATLGSTMCSDGKIHTITLGFRNDGVVIWRIDQ